MSRSRTKTFVVTQAPASRHIRAAALSRAYHRLPKIPALEQTARWWARASSGWPQRQLRGEKGKRNEGGEGGVPNALDGRRLEVVAGGLPLHGGAQLAIDTTMVSPLHADGTAHKLAATIDGAVCVDARRRKERTYPELLAPSSRAKLVVLALEVGGRWSTQRSHWLSSAFSPGPRQGVRPVSCANVWNRLGG